VAGRAGRHHNPGRVLVQTYMPEHPAIQFALAQNFKGFAEQELIMREALGYPPFGRLAVIRVDGPDLSIAEREAQMVSQKVKNIQGRHDEMKNIEILGPVEAALSKLKGRYRFQTLLKSSSAKHLGLLLQFLMQRLDDLPSNVRVSVDMDPLQLL
jgi:primosomal protein N' (replication factor Y)